MHHIKKINYLIYVLFTLFFAFSIGFTWAIKNKSNEIQEKDLKISTLISEVGKIKQHIEEREIVINEISKQNLSLYDYINSIDNILEKELTISKEEYSKLHASQENKEQQLTKLLSAKEVMISDLYKQNNALGNQLLSQAINSNTENILILGENSGLMDTILIASINTSTKKINIISIPRDLYFKGRKINELYAKYGIKEIKSAIQEITGVSVTSYAIWDFTSFKVLIDQIGGVKIVVEKSLIDQSYPNGNGGYTTVTFSPGEQIMDGDKALKYARSRKSTSDFDRAYRQQQIIKSVIDAIKQQDLVSKVDMALKIYATIKPNLETDIDFFQALSLFTKYAGYQFGENLVLSTSNLLTSSHNSNGQYILTPKENNYNAIHEKVAQMIQ